LAPGAFDRTVGWPAGRGTEPATSHPLPPPPGTRLYRRMAEAGRILHSDWDRYDTRTVVFKPARMTARQLEDGYWRAYRDFYRWGSILRGASTQPTLRGKARHAAYAGGWKKFEPAWDLLIRAKRAGKAVPLLEAMRSGLGCSPVRRAPAGAASADVTPAPPAVSP